MLTTQKPNEVLQEMISLVRLIAITKSSKGGVGKSEFVRQLLYTWIHQRLQLPLGYNAVIIDFDHLNKTNTHVDYRGWATLLESRLSEDPENNYYIVESLSEAMDIPDSFIACDLPAGAFDALSASFDSGDLSVLLESGYHPVFFFLSDSSLETKNEFIRSIEKYGEVIPHIFVKNNHFKLALFDDLLRDPKLVAFAEKGSFYTIEMPSLPTLPLQMLKDTSLPLALIDEAPSFQKFMKRKLTIYIPFILEQLDQAMTYALTRILHKTNK